MIAWNFQRIVGTCQFRVPWFGYPCGYSSLTIVMPPAKLSITLSVYKTISIAESDLFLQKMTKSDLLTANHFFKVHLSLAI